jgi:hypothetical protein
VTRGGRRGAKSSVGRKKPSKKPAAKKPKPKSKRVAPIEELRADEPKRVLQSLIRRHPELRTEAEELALKLIGGVDPQELGSELRRRLREIDIFDLADSPTRGGRYVPLWAAAQETLDDLLEPYLVDLKRTIALGLKEAAQSTCLGIVLGLYGARDFSSDDSLLAHAPDFCENEAQYVVGLLAKESGRLHRRRWPLPDGSDALLTDWPWIFSRGSRRKKQR